MLSVPAAHGAVMVEGPREGPWSLPGPGGGDVEVVVPFRLARDGGFYAKLLVTPWNAVNGGQPNGSVSADHALGLAGWWVRFALRDAAGQPLAADAEGKPLPQDLGVYVDSTPTRVVALRGGEPYQLVAAVHVPAAALAGAGGPHRVAFALAFRDPEAAPGPSGATLDPSQGYTATLAPAGANPLAPAVIAPPPPPAASLPAPPAAPATAGTRDALGTALLAGILVALLLLLAVGIVAARALRRIARHVELRAALLPASAPRAGPGAAAAPPTVEDLTPPASGPAAIAPSAAPAAPPAAAPGLVAAPAAPAMPQPAVPVQPARPAAALGPGEDRLVAFTRVLPARPGPPRPGPAEADAGKGADRARESSKP